MKRRMRNLVWCLAMAVACLGSTRSGEAQTTGILREVFYGIRGNNVSDLTSATNFPAHPALVEILTDSFETPVNLTNYYGQRLHGFLMPPATGNYFFWISSDDQSVLNLSTDDDPAHKVDIASVSGATGYREWDAEPTQMSPPVYLETDRLYYLEVLMKEGSGSDNLSVRWQLPDGTIEEPMPAWYFMPANLPLKPPVITQQPTNTTVPEGGSVVFRVQVSNLDPVGYQWQRGGINIIGATQPALTNAFVQVGDHGVRYRCVITNSLGITNSAEAILSVTPDLVPPAILSVANVGSRSLQVVFSEAVYKADQPGNYLLNNGVTVTAVTATPDPRVYLLTTSPLGMPLVYVLTVREVTDRAAARNRIPPNTTKSFLTAEYSPQIIGAPGLTNGFFPLANGYQLTSSGVGPGGTNDQLLFSYQMRTNDFDIKVRIKSLSPVAPWAQAGLMARETLNPNSRFAATVATPGLSGCYFSYRLFSQLSPARSGRFPSTPPATWLRLQRQGDRFSGYASFDGEQWAFLGLTQLSITNPLYLGLMVASHDTNLWATAEFQDLSVVTANATVSDQSDGFEPLGPSTRATGLVISEIMYHPLPRSDGKQLEFIELYNANDAPIDLSGGRIDGAIHYSFPPGTLLVPGAFLVLAKSPADIQSVYQLNGVLGPYEDRLENRSGNLRLRNALGGVLLDAQYSGEPPWPVAADGGGHSLVLARPSFGEGHREAWAASHTIGGSPGQFELPTLGPLNRVRINEFLAHTPPPSRDFIELYNHNAAAVDISGCVLTDDPQRSRFVVPQGTVMTHGGFLSFDERQLGFALDSRGETIYFLNPTRDRVIDAIRFGAQANNTATGRYPDGADAIQELAAPTPGLTNQIPRVRDIVINEIMYNPISDEAGGEFVELHNRGTREVDLSGWQFLDGIDFTFPEGTRIAAGGYLAVAQNASQLRAFYPDLDPSRIVGDFGGNLSNAGERLALGLPQLMTVTNANGSVTEFTAYVVADEVSYETGGRWGRWSDGDGSSLELVDPHADNRLPSNWADSDDTAKAPWTTIETTGVLDHGDDSFGINTVQILLMDVGECLVDNVEVHGPGGENLVTNPTFDGGISDLILRGNHKQSLLQSNGGINNSRCLRVRTTGRGDTGPNQVTLPLKASLQKGAQVTLRAQVRWLRGTPEILLRLRGNFLEAAGRMTLPTNLGTPGAANSQKLNNAGPAIYEVQHQPILPQAFEPVRITTRVQDPDGVAGLTLNYRYDPAVSVHSVPMFDNGTAGDEISGDGIYTALIPGQPTGTLIAFSLQARDVHIPPASASFPADAPTRECLIRFGETQPPGQFGTYRLWFTQATADEWTNREQGSNEPLDATFVYGNSRAIYHIGAFYSGSPWHWTGYNGPTNNLCNYSLVMPKDDLFLGTQDFVLNAPSNLGSDSTGIRERLAHFMAEQIGLPSTHRRFIHLFVNGLRRSFVFEDVQQPNREFVTQWYPETPDGELYKIEDWFEYNDSANGFNNVDATLDNFTTLNGEKKLARYRWTWRKRATQNSAHDYRSLFQLVDAVNTAETGGYGEAVTALVDIEQWMKTMALRHAIGDWDAYGYQRGKNMYAYWDPTLDWVLLNWDISFAFGLGDGPSHDIFDTMHFDGTIDQVTDRMFHYPTFRRMYLQAMQTIVNLPFRSSPIDTYLQSQYGALVDNGVSVSSPDTIRSWMDSRRTYVERVLATNKAPFEVTVDASFSSKTNKNLIRLAGTAPLNVKSIQVNGHNYPLSWSAVNGWSLIMPVSGGLNQLVVRGLDASGALLAGAQTNLTVTYSGAVELPEDRIVLNEIMYNAEVPGAEYLELFNRSTTQFFDLSGYAIAGVDFVFEPGTLIPPQGYLLVVEDRSIFEQTYGLGLPIAGVYQGRLNNAGEAVQLIQPGPTAETARVIGEVVYGSQPPWPTAADGTGSSLQLIDPLQPENRIGNWSAVSTNGRATPRWQYVSLTGKATGSTLLLSLSGPGEVLIDDLMLVAGITPSVGVNLIKNGGFESPLAEGWTAWADHGLSTIVSSGQHSGNAALHLIALGAQGSVSQILQPAPVSGEFYTLSYWYYSGEKAVDLTVQIPGTGLTSVHGVESESLARRTPGAPNSVRATLAPLPALWINEVQAHNVAGITDASGQAEPWIELYNAGTTSVRLGDYYLSDNYTNLTQWAFPAEAVISPGQFVLVWADGESQPGTGSEWHTSFRLPPVTGQVALSRSLGGNLVLMDYLDYSGLAAGLSIGNYPDGYFQQRDFFISPTPGASNTNKPTGVRLRINEWMASNTLTLADPADGDFEDWLELYNATEISLSLDGFALSDDLTNPSKWIFPNNTVIPPKGFLLIWADEENSQNTAGSSWHTNFKLSRNGEEIGLFDPTGQLLDVVRFGAQSDDVSEGRWPDGSATIQRLSQATPGAPNRDTNQPGDELRVDYVELSGLELRLHCRTVAGHSYLVQYQDSLSDPSWLNLGSPILATGSETVFADTLLPGTAQRFYRIIQLP